ncbi:hypothetical protein ACI2IX_04405 [Leifsonia aquatica]|uniref:hypothetical protein n=1 Tax=Leifsonia aquatica TaxID=144185 RepID=UPI00384CCEED
MKWLCRTATALTVVATVALLTACDLFVPQSTKTNGETSDGVSGQLGAVYVANAVLIASDRRAELGTPGIHHVMIDDFAGRPGALYPLYFHYGDETGLRLGVPVLTTAQPQYRDLGPSVAPAPR